MIFFLFLKKKIFRASHRLATNEFINLERAGSEHSKLVNKFVDSTEQEYLLPLLSRLQEYHK